MRTGICPFCGKKVDKFIMFRGDVVGCRYCGIHMKQTNADRIRAMSDEELAAFLSNLSSDGCKYGWCPARDGCEAFSDKTCKEQMEKWLKMEEKE